MRIAELRRGLASCRLPSGMLRGVYETVLYANDLPAAAEFYRSVLDLRVVKPVDELMVAFRLPDGGVLLIFDPSESRQPGRSVPSHGMEGSGAGGHVAFRIDHGEYDKWVARLRSHGVEIESEISWESGARSIYFRDPAGNSVELVEGEIWPL